MINLDPILSLIATRGGSISRHQLGLAVDEIKPPATSGDTYAATNAIKALLIMGHLDEGSNGKLTLADPAWARLPSKGVFRAVLCGAQLDVSNQSRQFKAKQEISTFAIYGSIFTVTVTMLEAALPSDLQSAAEASRFNRRRVKADHATGMFSVRNDSFSHPVFHRARRHAVQPGNDQFRNPFAHGRVASRAWKGLAGIVVTGAICFSSHAPIKTDFSLWYGYGLRKGDKFTRGFRGPFKGSEGLPEGLVVRGKLRFSAEICGTLRAAIWRG